VRHTTLKPNALLHLSKKIVILLTGAGGQLGQCFQQLATQYPPGTFYPTGSDILDISDRPTVLRFFENNPLSCCINCAAYTGVDKAESEPAIARRINVQGVKNLAEACARIGIPLIHFSTDYVYHSRQNTPFREEDPVRPKGVYARTKLAGERAALKAYPGAMVIRTSWVYARQGHNFVNTMLRLGRERAEIKVVFDQIGTPTYAPDLAEAVMTIIQQLDNKAITKESLAGIWHYSNEGVTSWYDFAKAIFEIKKIPCMALPIETKDFPTPARRPPFSVLNKGKIKDAFGLDIPHWRDSLRRCLEI